MFSGIFSSAFPVSVFFFDTTVSSITLLRETSDSTRFLTSTGDPRPFPFLSLSGDPVSLPCVGTSMDLKSEHSEYIWGLDVLTFYNSKTTKFVSSNVIKQCRRYSLIMFVNVFSYRKRNLLILNNDLILS